MRCWTGLVEELIAPPPASVAKKSRVDPVPDLFSSAPAVKPESEPTPSATHTTHAGDYDRDSHCDGEQQGVEVYKSGV